MRDTTSVLFDLYGTLVDVRLDEDSPALWDGLTGAMRQRGALVYHAAELRHRYHQILWDESERRENGFLMDAVFARLIALFRADLDVATFGRLFRRLSSTSRTLRPYVEPLFAALRDAGCRIGIVSNTEAVLTRFDLDQFPQLHAADAIVLSSEVGVKKPDPRIMAIALERLHAEAASAVFIGDSLADDVAGARRAGLRAVFLDPHARDVGPLPLWDGDAWRAPPTLDGLTSALAACGWRAVGSST